MINVPATTAAPIDADLLSAELSLLAFQRRVLALAEDPSTPLLERFRFLGIVTSNIDELYMVRMAELRRDAAESREDVFTTAAHGYTPAALLAAVERQIEEILAAQSVCAAHCLADAALYGIRLLTWSELTDTERERLRVRYLEEIQPDLMPLAITLAPGFPLPHLPHLGLFVGVVYRSSINDRAHLSEHELPRDVPRLLAVPDREGAVIAIEELLRAHAHLLYPNAIVDGVYIFRVTRGGDLPLHDDDAGDLLGAVASATERRPNNPAVRVEVERSMPPEVGALIIDNLRREAIGRDMELTVHTVQVVDGMLDLRCLQSLPMPAALSGSEHDPSFEFPTLTPAVPVPSDVSLLDAIRHRELLVHHPFASFDETVVRFLRDAAADPQVMRISATLYRVGDPSPIVEALLHAARGGKQVFVLVELQARFDEVHNVQWARALERAGGRVVYGIAGLKVHAKAAMVVRREGDELVTYVHVGTGNYNPRSGRLYTDLSLFSTRPSLVADVSALFASLAADTTAPPPLSYGAFVAPQQLLSALLYRIDRETAHAVAGRSAHITIKLNGIADTEVVRALYRAAQAGVRIDLIVRGICTLRPGVAALSPNIRVVSVVGRFLEHSRVYRFANNGSPEYYIGSSDLRSRNLRRRVELLVPVEDAAHRVQLDDVLARYLNDPTAWELTESGAYVQHLRGGESAQSYFASTTASAP